MTNTTTSSYSYWNCSTNYFDAATTCGGATSYGVDYNVIRTIKSKYRITDTTDAATIRYRTDGGDDVYWSPTTTKWTWDTCGDADVEMTYVGTGLAWNQAVWPARVPLTPEERIKEIIASRQAPTVFVKSDHRKALPHTTDIRELRARETLHRVIGDEKYQRLIRDGFVSVRGKDNLHYQIFPGHGITCVFKAGQMVERLCVVLNGDFPPTDSIIMRYLMILNNPAQFRSFAIKHNVTKRQSGLKIVGSNEPVKSLTEIFAELKRKAA